MIRTRKLPGSYSDEEMAKIEADAKKEGLEPTTYVRKKLKLPAVKMGAPKGNKNAAIKRKDAGRKKG